MHAHRWVSTWTVGDAHWATISALWSRPPSAVRPPMHCSHCRRQPHASYTLVHTCTHEEERRRGAVWTRQQQRRADEHRAKRAGCGCRRRRLCAVSPVDRRASTQTTRTHPPLSSSHTQHFPLLPLDPAADRSVSRLAEWPGSQFFQTVCTSNWMEFGPKFDNSELHKQTLPTHLIYITIIFVD